MMASLKATILAAGLASSFAALLAGSPAQALTMKECSAKYQAAQTAGTLNGMKWNDFRKAQCASDAAAAPAAAPAPAAAAAPAPAPTPVATKAKAAPAPTPAVQAKAAAPAAAGSPVFPTAVSAKYSSESAGKARMHTCLDQYNANKAGSGNGGLNWIEKGGGYYSQCNAKLKG